MSPNQDIRYNRNFNDADAARLCQLAQLANHPQHRYYTCGWVNGNMICSSFVQSPNFSDHLRTHHGIVGSDQAMVMCRWVGCFAEMKKESLMRHINEKHLEVRHACPHCPEQFTRPYTMNGHIQKKHPDN